MENPATKVANPSFYDLLEMPIGSTQESLQLAYRRLALLHHPDRQSGNPSLMRQINEAWFVLSDPDRRSQYDQTLRKSSPVSNTQQSFSTRPKLGKKAAWFAGIRLQTLRLGDEAARSAIQALSIRHKTPQSTYKELAAPITQTLGRDTKKRVQQSRRAGAAPLDLALAAGLVGLNTYCTPFIRNSLRQGITEADVYRAQLIDRMWDNLAHGISREVEVRLGGNPRALKSLTGRRV